MYVQPTNYKPKPQTPYGQIIIVNKIYYSYLHVKSGAVCPQAFNAYIVAINKMRKFMSLSFVNEHRFFAVLLSMKAAGLPNIEAILRVT